MNNLDQKRLQNCYFWQRQKQLYGIYAAQRFNDNSYDCIKRVSSDDYFLNYIEYDAKNISPDTLNRYLDNAEDILNHGLCSGVHKGSRVLRQLDWYYNNETEFVIRMKKCVEKGVLYDSIGVTASSPRLTVDMIKRHFEKGGYDDYFDMLPYMTVDGVNEKGIFAQSNVVEVNDVRVIDINPQSKIKCCCNVSLVRYILDHVGNIDELDEKLSVLHLYNARRDKLPYNSHILVADGLGNTRVIEFKEDRYEIVDKFHVMTNFRLNNGFDFKEGSDVSADWSKVEHNGIGVERWEQGNRFIADSSMGDLNSFRQLRKSFNYTHAYDRPIQLSTWLTDNLSADLNVTDAFEYHDGTITTERKAKFDQVLSGYYDMYINRTRESGKTWHTTHSCIYDLVNLSCNIQSQENKCYNVYFNGRIVEEEIQKKTLTVHKEYGGSGSVNAYLKIDGKDAEYDKPIEIDNDRVSIQVGCTGGDRFTRFSFEDPSVNHEEYIYEVEYTVNETHEITARFDPYWT